MNFALIYSKTARGNDECQSHSRALTPAMRRMLILIDGRRTAAELELIARDGEFEAIIAALKAHGLIEGNGPDVPPGPAARVPSPDATTLIVRPGGPADRRTTPSPATVPPPEPTPAELAALAARNAATLEENKRAAISALYARLGPYGEEPASRMLTCKTIEALHEQIRSAGQRIAVFRGEKAAQEYMTCFGVVHAPARAATPAQIPVTSETRPLAPRPGAHQPPPATLQPL
jgi:hypothetical protein